MPNTGKILILMLGIRATYTVFGLSVSVFVNTCSDPVLDSFKSFKANATPHSISINTIFKTNVKLVACANMQY